MGPLIPILFFLLCYWAFPDANLFSDGAIYHLELCVPYDLISYYSMRVAVL